MRGPWYRLHADFVDALRAAHDDGRAPAGSSLWFHRVVVRRHSRDCRRVQRVADAIGYLGPILGDESRYD